MSKITVIGLVGKSVFLPVERFHEGGETVEALSLFTEPGGKGFNQAVAARRFGADVTFVSAIGDDGYRAEAENFLRNEGIEPLLIEKKGPSAFACIVTDRSGHTRVTEYIGAELSAEDIFPLKEKIESADWLILGNETPEAVNLIAAKIAAAKGVKILCNPAPRRKMSEEFLSLVDLLTPNESEAEGLEDLPNVIVTLGGKGCYVRPLDRAVPATDDKPIDTTGAGDTFNGVLAAVLAEGGDLLAAVRAATGASGKSVTKRGAATSIPRRSDIFPMKG